MVLFRARSSSVPWIAWSRQWGRSEPYQGLCSIPFRRVQDFTIRTSVAGDMTKEGHMEQRKRKSKAKMELPVLNPDAAGIDVGATEMYVAVPPDRDLEPIRCFRMFTEDLNALADWLWVSWLMEERPNAIGRRSQFLMMPFRKVLFPIDFSDAAVAMVPYVTEMAQRFNATVTVLNAFNLVPDFSLAPSLPGALDSEPMAIPYTPNLQELRKQREQHLEEFARTQFPGLAHTARIEDGDPAMVIERTAQRENTDLIMMPTKGHGRFRRLLFGSVTAKVLHDISCPVFTSAHEPDQASGRHGYRSILCAVELNPEADVVFKAAAFLADAYRARVCLLHIEPSSHEHGGEASAQTIRSAFDQALKSEGRKVGDITVRVLDVAIPEGIRRTATEEKADVVVVGRGHQRDNLSRIWSHLYTIIRESPCPVLSV